LTCVKAISGHQEQINSLKNYGDCPMSVVRVLASLGLSIVLLISPSALVRSQMGSGAYFEAERNFQTSFDLHQRIALQVLLTAAGYWDAVPDKDFSQRLFQALMRFEK
jgi:serine protease Do